MNPRTDVTPNGFPNGIPKKSLGPITVVALAVVVLAVFLWTMWAMFGAPGTGIEELFRLGR